MKIVSLDFLTEEQIKKLVQRPAVDFESVFPKVREILLDVKENGDRAVRKYARKFDSARLTDFRVSVAEFRAADKLNQEVKRALKKAAGNIQKFHQAGLNNIKNSCGSKTETTKGIECWFELRPIEKVGLYVPKGLISTVLMLGIPAELAGCKEIVMATPPDREGRVSAEMLFAAKIAGITKIFKIGGAQAVAAMSYGTESVPKTDKLFGPGNQYVTAAKMLASIDPGGAAIDLPAGPSEILIVADKSANPGFVAADLLSQAEHGSDSQVVLVSDSKELVEKVKKEIKLQSEKYQTGRRFAPSCNCSAIKRDRKKIKINESLFGHATSKWLIIIAGSIDKAIAFANLYAPEHLVLNVKSPEKYISRIKNAGSVFIGPYSAVAVGDYASGVNHTLPTSGFAKSCSGLSVDSFIKKPTFQRVSRTGLHNIARTVEILSEAELMGAHKRAVGVRLKALTKAAPRA